MRPLVSLKPHPTSWRDWFLWYVTYESLAVSICVSETVTDPLQLRGGNAQAWSWLLISNQWCVMIQSAHKSDDRMMSSQLSRENWSVCQFIALFTYWRYVAPILKTFHLQPTGEELTVKLRQEVLRERGGGAQVFLSFLSPTLTETRWYLQDGGYRCPTLPRRCWVIAGGWGKGGGAWPGGGGWRNK